MTGGYALTPNFDARLSAGIRSILPAGQPYHLARAADVRRDAWRGLAKYARSSEFGAAAWTKAEYNEMGVEYLKENRLLPIWTV